MLCMWPLCRQSYEKYRYVVLLLRTFLCFPSVVKDDGNPFFGVSETFKPPVLPFEPENDTFVPRWLKKYNRRRSA